MSHCSACGKPFPNDYGRLKKHIKNSPPCYKKWRDELETLLASVSRPPHTSAGSALDDAPPEDVAHIPMAVDEPEGLVPPHFSNMSETSTADIFSPPSSDRARPQEPASRVTASGPPRQRHVLPFPRPAGVKIRRHATSFERIRKAEEERFGGNPWWPFKDREEYELARWLVRHVGQNSADEFLKLSVVRCVSCIFVNVNLTSSSRSRSAPTCHIRIGRPYTERSTRCAQRQHHGTRRSFRSPVTV